MNRLYVTYRHKIYVHTREQMGSFYPTDITRRHKEREREKRHDILCFINGQRSMGRE